MQAPSSYQNNNNNNNHSTNNRNSPKKKPVKETSSGWEYWTRIYSEDNNQNSNSNTRGQAVRDMRISDMLASECLIRAKLLFLNVPGLPTGYKNIILHLLKRELREEIPIQDVIVQPGKWYLHFYRPEDALRVLKVFNGFTYRSHTLVVRFCYPDGTFGDETALNELVACTNSTKTQLQPSPQNETAGQDTVADGVWSPIEQEAVWAFERELIQILKNKTFMPYYQAISTIRTTFVDNNLSYYFISDALGQWSTGFIRIFHRTIKVVANTICLASNSYYAQRMRESAAAAATATATTATTATNRVAGGKAETCGDTAANSASVNANSLSVQRDSWEPYVPDDIRSEVQLKQYAHAFLCHFGPQHVHIDIPIRLLAQSLRGIWPKTGHELAELLTKISAGFVIINNVLYLSAYDRHNEFIIDNLAAYQDDSDENVCAPLDMDHKTMPIASLDQM